MTRLTDRRIQNMIDSHRRAVSKGFSPLNTFAFSARGEELAEICLARGKEIAKLKNKLKAAREQLRNVGTRETHAGTHEK